MAKPKETVIVGPSMQAAGMRALLRQPATQTAFKATPPQAAQPARGAVRPGPVAGSPPPRRAPPGTVFPPPRPRPPGAGVPPPRPPVQQIPELPVSPNGTLSPGTIYRSSRSEGIRYYLPEYDLRVVDGQFKSSLKWRSARSRTTPGRDWCTRCRFPIRLPLSAKPLLRVPEGSPHRDARWMTSSATG